MSDAAAKMIDAAERLVAEGGLSALTVQAVQDAAGQRNKSAVAYHFGDRDGLLDAVIQARMADAVERRTHLLLHLDPHPSVRQLVEVLVVPLAESVFAREPSYWARFLVQAMNDPGTGRSALGAGPETLQLARVKLAGALDHVPERLRDLRVQSLLGYACVALAAYELRGAADPDRFLVELVDTCCGLVSAPTTLPDDLAAPT